MLVPRNRKQWLEGQKAGSPGNVSYPIPIEKGGTGATDAAGARTNLHTQQALSEVASVGIGQEPVAGKALAVGGDTILNGGLSIPAAGHRQELGESLVAAGGQATSNIDGVLVSPSDRQGICWASPADTRGYIHAQQDTSEVVNLELGALRGSAGPAHIDFHTRAQPASDFDARLIAWDTGDFSINTSGHIGLNPGSGKGVLINSKLINALATKKVFMGTVLSTGGMPNTAGDAWRWTNTQTVTFAEPFSSLPIVLACVCTTSGISTMAVTSKRLDAFDWRAFEYGSADPNRNVTMNWIAIGD